MSDHDPTTLVETCAALRREIGPPSDRDHMWSPMVSAGEVRLILDALAAEQARVEFFEADRDEFRRAWRKALAHAEQAAHGHEGRAVTSVIHNPPGRHDCNLGATGGGEPKRLHPGAVEVCAECHRVWVYDPIPWERTYRPIRPWPFDREQRRALTTYRTGDTAHE